MTTQIPLPRVLRRSSPHKASSALVVALLLFGASFGAAFEALADGGSMSEPLPPTRASTIEGTVSAVQGTVLDVIGGQFRIDVANATITSGDGPSAGTLPATSIPVGARIVAVVPVGDALPTVFPPPPFPATSVIVFLPRDGQLTSTIQGVDVAGGTFTMFFHSISTNAATKWSGFSGRGSVKGIGDLVTGMIATVSVVNSGGGLLAISVDAFGTVTPPHLIAFRGPVQSIGATQWQIDGRLVQVNSATKIVGDPRVGDIVDVIAESPAPAGPGLGTAVIPTALSIIKTAIIVPPGPGDRATEFDGRVESIPPVASPGAVALGHWKISSRDVVVNGLTKVDSGIEVGTAVHVKGAFLISSAAGGGLFSTQFVASEIRKK